MYTITVDGKLLFSTDSMDDEHIILSPKLSLETEGAGSLSFDMQPGHPLYNGINKLKSIVTVEQDGKVIFRGRAMDDEKDFYNQKNVYCEGDLSFLLDSVYAPDIYKGKVKAFFIHLIEKHNEQVDPEKRFAIGVIDAVDDETPYEATERVETRVYWDISTIINSRLLGPYGGYLRTRTEGGTTYIDWLKKSGDTNSQTIEFSVNLLDLKDKVDASEVFTVLIPQGYAEIGDDGTYGDPLSIASVNGGLEYIQDDAAVALYGKIWRTKTWSQEKDPTALLTKAREFMKTGIAVQTLTLKLIDMHFLSGSADAIQIGQYVRILSDPHGLDITLNCTKIDIDLLNPENTTYTFGEKPRTLTENVVRAEEEVSELTGGGRGGGGGRSVQEEASDILRWAKIIVDEANANINLNAGEINKLDGRVSAAEINIDGLNAQILLKASQKTVDDLTERVSQAEIDIDGANAQILLKASQTTVDALGERVSAAEIEIDGINSQITLKADKIDLQGYVTASQLTTEFTNFQSGISNSLYVSALSANTFECSSFSLGGYGMSLQQATFLTSSTSLTVNSTGGTVTGVTLNKKTNTIYYYSWE